MKKIEWSDLQLDIFDHAATTRDNMIIQAAAGSGKSTTLFEMVRRLAKKYRSLNIMFLSFNKEIQKHAQKSLLDVTNCKVFTFHGYGNHLIHSSGFGKKWGSEMDVSKVYKHVFDSSNKFVSDKKKHLFRLVTQLRTLGFLSYDIQLMRQFLNDSWAELFGYPNPNLKKLLSEQMEKVALTLQALDDDKVLYDFDDMCRFPLLYEMFDAKQMPQNRVPDVIMVDECFPYQTLVLVEQYKWVQIGEIVENPDKYTHVLSYDLERKEVVKKRITSVKKSIADETKVFFVSHTESNTVGSFRCTPNHKLYVIGKGVTLAQDVVLGDTMIAFIDGTYVVQRIENRSESLNVYDLNVEDTHLFWIQPEGDSRQPLLVHNCQDLNEYQFLFIERLMERGARVISCGDRFQSIYGFRGADMYSMDRLKTLTSSVELPLSITYRCHSNIVRFVRSKMPKDNMPQIEPFFDGGKVIRKDTSAQDPKTGDIYDLERLLSSETQMVVSPKNKHLMSIWISLFQKGIPASLKGSKITNALTNLLKTLRGDKVLFEDAESRCYAISNMEYIDDHTRDLATTCFEFLNRLQFDSYEQAEARLKQIAENDKGIKLHTIHSAKGLESEKVWFINDMFESDQELNMLYVGLTRASTRLYYVTNEAWGPKKYRSEMAGDEG